MRSELIKYKYFVLLLLLFEVIFLTTMFKKKCGLLTDHN